MAIAEGCRRRRPLSVAMPGGLALAALLGLAGCSADRAETEVRGEVLTRADPYLGGPDPAVAEFRAGERSSYGR